MKVKATEQYEKLKLKDKELGRIPKKGEEFEVSEQRYKELTETNKFNTVFVEKVEEEEEIEIEQKKIKKETAVKKIKKKAK